MPQKKQFITCEICRTRTSRENGKKRLFMANFPLDEDRCRQWVKFVGNEDLIHVPIEKLYKLKYICENHFEDKAFNKKRSRLKKTAIPSKNFKRDPLPDEKLLDFPCHVYSNTAVSHVRLICDSKLSQPQKETISGPSKPKSYAPVQQLPSQAIPSKKDKLADAIARPNKLVLYCVPVHRFPHPERKSDLFNAWVSLVGNRLKETNQKKIYKTKRVCDHHFHPLDKMSKDRLKPSAVPSVNLHRMRQSITTHVSIDHNYSAKPHREILNLGTQKPITNQVAPGPTSEISQIPSGSSEGCLAANEKEPTCLIDLSLKQAPLENIRYDDTWVEDDISPSPVPPESAVEDTGGDEDTGGKEVGGGEKIFSWQTTELIEADDPDPETPFSDPPPKPSADQAVPEQTVPNVDDSRCNGCREINYGFEYWCVQCACGVLCEACALRARHRAHYVLRAPVAATRAQTQAVLAIIRHQLRNCYMISDRATEENSEVKHEPEDEPEDEPVVEPVAESTEEDEPMGEPGVEPGVQPGVESGVEPTDEPMLEYRISRLCTEPDPLACDDEADTQVYECSNKETVSHPPTKRRRLIDSSAKKNIPTAQEIGSQDVQHTELKGSQTVPHLQQRRQHYDQRETSHALSGSEAKKSKIFKGLLPAERSQVVPHAPRIKESQALQTEGSDIPKTSQALQTIHIIPIPQHKKPCKVPVLDFSNLSIHQIALLSRLKGFEVVQHIPKESLRQHSQAQVAPNSDIPQHSQHIIQVEQNNQTKETLTQDRPALVSQPRGSQAPTKVTSEGLPQIVLIDLDDVGEGETVEYLEESLLESDQETVVEGNETQIVLQGNERETVVQGSDTETELQENTETVFDEETEDLEGSLPESNPDTVSLGNDAQIDLQEKEGVFQGNRETLQQSDTESIDDDVLDKDYRVDEELDDSDESRTGLYLESLIGHRPKRLATREASGKHVKEKTLPARFRLPEAVVQLRCLTSLEIRKWTSGKRRRRKD